MSGKRRRLTGLPNFPPEFFPNVGNAAVKHIFSPENAVAAGQAVAGYGVKKLQKYWQSRTDDGQSPVGGYAYAQNVYSTPATIKAARKQARRAGTGTSSSVLEDDTGICPAMFAPGKGLGLPYVAENYQPAVTYKSGLGSGPAHRPADAVTIVANSSRNCHVKHDFAFKIVNEVLSKEKVNTRVYVVNCFRHMLFEVNRWTQSNLAGSSWNTERKRWHSTLGPDNAFVRKQFNDVVQPGVCITPFTGSQDTTLKSPYRSPKNGQWMYSRLTSQLMENIGWNANVFKLKGMAAISGGVNSTSDQEISIVPLQVYNNANYATFVDGPSASYQNTIRDSLPAQQAKQLTVIENINQGPYYQSQFGYGKIEYTFQNDSTCPVVIDIVIHGIKRGQTLKLNSGGFEPTGLNDTNDTCPLRTAYGQGYLQLKLGQRGVADLGGTPPLLDDVLTDSKVEFMPAACLKYQNKNFHTSEANYTLAPRDAAPIKQIGRDQIIIPAGSQQSWSMTLPRMSYKASDYRLTASSDSATNAGDAGMLNDKTFMLAIAASSISIPQIENGTHPMVVDRSSASVNVSVKGTYSEICEPVFPIMPKNSFYINGDLDVPYYTSGTKELESANILSAHQSVRTSATSGHVRSTALNVYENA
ncbi:MAG: putative capsid protein [Circoviridae sp.]|nr:MAG: putative capsid protein [Circoviridae sp.]